MLAIEWLDDLAAPVDLAWGSVDRSPVERGHILSHLSFLARAVRHDVDRTLAVRVIREYLRAQSTALTGNRMDPIATGIGGVAADPSDKWRTQ